MGHHRRRSCCVPQGSLPYAAASVAGDLRERKYTMGIRKRGSVWWIDLTTPSGERVRRSAETGTKAEATEFHDRLKAEAWRQQKLDEAPRRIWNDAVVRWCKEQSHKATAEEDKAKLRWLDRHLGGKKLDTINRDMLNQTHRPSSMTVAAMPRSTGRLRSGGRFFESKYGSGSGWIGHRRCECSRSQHAASTI